MGKKIRIDGTISQENFVDIPNSYRFMTPLLIIIFAISTISAYLGDAIRQFCE